MTTSSIIVGKFGKPFGVKGWLHLYSYTHPLDAIMQYQPWLMNQQMIEIDEWRPHGNVFVVHLKNVNDPKSARAYTNQSLSVPRDQLPELKSNEYYWHDLIGMKIINQDNIELGVVDHLMEAQANDILVVLDEKRHLIPFLHNQTIKKVDLENKIILVDWDPEF